MPEPISRRAILKLAGAGAALAAGLLLGACRGGSDEGAGSDGGNGDEGGMGSGSRGRRRR